MRAHRSAHGERSDQRGVTLVELTIVLAILGMIVAGTMLLWEKTQQSYFQGSEAADLQGNLRVALDQMAHEVRRAGHSLTPPTFAPVDSTSNATTLRIRMDLNDNGVVTPASTNPNEDITFAFVSASSRITRNGQPLAEHIVANPDGTPVFQYGVQSTSTGGVPGAGDRCNGSAIVLDPGPSPANPGCVRRVTITLTARATIGGQTLTRTARTDVDLRTR